MFLKQERPEMDDFERRKQFDVKGKNFNIFRKYWEEGQSF